MANFSEVPWIAEHIALYKSDPAKAHDWDSTPLGGPGILPTLLLTTKGRTSNKPRSLPLIYGICDGSYVIIASKGGMPDHPVWYLNLRANPACTLQVGAKTLKGVARTVEGDEREKIWNMMVEIYPPYLDYQKATARRIPVVVIDPS